jgi:hypothetical protein
VTAVFNLEDGTEKEFTRVIKIQEHRSAFSLYFVGEKVINNFDIVLQQYLSLNGTCKML